jgi:GNAT superfamily N-acetyltransferase
MAEGRAPVLVRVARVYREKGPGGVWFAALSRLGYRRLVLVERPLEEPIARLTPRIAAEIRPLRRADEAAFVGLGQEDASVFRRRLEAGHQGWGAWCSGTLRHTRWLAFRETLIEYLRCRLLLDADVAYMHRSFTDAQYRGLGLAPATGAACMQALREQGYRLVVAAVLPEDPSVLPPVLKQGYRRMGMVRAIGGGRRPLIAVTRDRHVEAPPGWRIERSACRQPAAADHRA